MPLSEETLNMVTQRGVAEIIDENEFRRLLQKGDPLRLKMGFDPSSRDIHLGHVVGLRKLRQLQNLGHQVVLIVGDWTAQIGDPSGQSVTRPVLTHEDVIANAETYLRQFFKVVDESRTEVIWQSEWYGKFTLTDVVKLTGSFTVAQMLARDDFRKRFEQNRPIAITELLYPLLQAYDSVMVKADVEFGGTDQKFNLLMGRELQELRGQRPQQCFMVPILEGTDGVQKMSKSLGNYIGVDEAPQEQYGKVLSLPDNLIDSYFTLLTDTPLADIQAMGEAMASGAVNPMEYKKRLAREIVEQFWSADGAQAAQEHFERTVQRREAPEDIPTLRYASTGKGALTVFGDGGESQVASAAPAADVIHALGLASSKAEAKRLVSQGAVEVDGVRVTDTLPIHDGAVVKVGKRKFVRLVEDKG
ncbi:MAG: tyrosine--tRNA ligase [SAR202 cluster bacterium]|nr:tyrosine--tRNA ligase [SAR202 cluster bacterium]